MRKRKCHFNIDTLKISYKQPKGLFDTLSGYCVKDKIPMDGFSIQITDGTKAAEDEAEEIEIPDKISANVILYNREIASVVFYKTKYDGLCFLTVYNRALYTNEDKSVPYSKLLSDISRITKSMGLVINSITQLDIAADANFNVVSQIRRLIKNYDDYDMFVNAKKVREPNRIIEDYAEYFTRTRKRLKRTPTIYVKQARPDGIQIRAYNKSEEIEDNKREKDYIKDWDDFGTANIYRLEASIKWRELKKFFDWIDTLGHIPPEWQKHETETSTGYTDRFLHLIQFEDMRVLLWQFANDKVISFRSRSTKAPITMIDLLSHKTCSA